MNLEQLRALLAAGTITTEQLRALLAAGTITTEQLRSLLAMLTSRAEGLIAEVTDTTAAERRAEIEAEHQRALTEIGTVRERLAAAEAAEAAERERAAATGTGAGATDSAVKAAIAAERTRVAALQRMGGEFGRSEEFVRRHVDTGTSETDFGRAVLDDLRAQSGRGAPIFPHVAGGLDEVQSRREGMAAAIAVQLRHAGGERSLQMPANAQQWGGMGLAEMAAEASGYRGPLRTSRQVADMYERAFHTTSDFPGIFTNALNVTLLARYQIAAPSYRRWAQRYDGPDFRAMPVIRAGDFPALQAIGEAGEIKSGTFSESKEQQQVFPYGVMLRVTRQMLINDQLNAIAQVMNSAGDRVSDWENNKAYTLLASAAGLGPTLLTDNRTVFHSAHANLAGSGSAITIASVGAGRGAMMKQKTLDGMIANFTPTTLLVSPDKLTEAEQFLTTILANQIASAVPESLRRMLPVGDANLTGTRWYLFADPAVAPCFVYGYLMGFEGPRLSSEDAFDVQGMKVKLEHDFGAAAIDYRGGYSDPGA